MEFYDLTVHDKPNIDTNKLLGLSPKLCAQPTGIPKRKKIKW